MHEVSVVTSLVDAVIAELQKYNVIKVNSVTVVIGDLTNLGEEQMSFAYDIVTQGTILEGHPGGFRVHRGARAHRARMLGLRIQGAREGALRP